MWTYFAIAVGGILGCWARYFLSGWIPQLVGRSFPYATFFINVTGSFLMGFLFIETLERVTVSPALRAGILTGVLGGYTTFSTFSMESVLLIEEGRWLSALGYLASSVGLGVIGAVAGVWLARNH